MNFRNTFIAVVAFSVCACGTTTTQPKAISTAAAAQWIKSEPRPVILDVRTSGEFSEGHIAGAKRITWTDRDFETRSLKELDRTEPVLVYCRSGARSSAAAKKLGSLGFTRVRHLEGGTLAWKKAGLPLTQAH